MLTMFSCFHLCIESLFSFLFCIIDFSVFIYFASSCLSGSIDDDYWAPDAVQLRALENSECVVSISLDASSSEWNHSQ